MNNKKNTRSACEQLHSGEKAFKTAGNIEFLLFIIGLLIAMFAVRAFLVEPVRVEGESMINTLQDGERCFVEKVSYLFSSPKQGDIVIVRFPERGRETFVKRVVAVGGQTISLGSENVIDPETNEVSIRYFVLIDGERLDESAYENTMYFDEGWPNIQISCEGSRGGSFTVPEGYVFVMGDHRTNSHDSRKVGPIPLCDVVGRVHGTVYPFKDIRKVK